MNAAQRLERAARVDDLQRTTRISDQSGLALIGEFAMRGSGLDLLRALAFIAAAQRDGHLTCAEFAALARMIEAGR